MKISNARARSSAVSGKIASVLGFMLAPLFLLCSFALFSVDTDDGGTFFFAMLALPIFLIIKGRQIKHRIIRFKKYTALVIGQQIFSIHELAVSVSKTDDFVRKDLQKMIAKGYFIDMEIDMAANRVIAGSRSALTQAAMQEKMDRFETYTCPGCNATGVKPKGEYAVCEFCGRTV